MNNDESDVQDFLQRVARSLTAFLGWLFLNMTGGIFAGYLFFTGTPGIRNIIFYSWMIASLAALLWYLSKTWRKKFPHG